MNTCMHSVIFAGLFLASAIEARRGLPLQIDDLATVVFHFGGGFGVVWVNELKGALSGVKKVVQSRSPFRWLWVVMVFAEIYRVSVDFGGLVRAPARFFPTTLAVRSGCTYVPS